MVLGLPGSGKSFFAERLALKLDGVYISSDQLRKKINMSGKYSLTEKTLVYQEMENLTKGYLQANRLVILDATFYLRKFRNSFISLSKSLQCPYFLIQVVADDALTKQRMARSRAYSEADYTVYQLLKKEYEPIDSPHLTISSESDNIVQMLKLACDYIQEHRK